MMRAVRMMLCLAALAGCGTGWAVGGVVVGGGTGAGPAVQTALAEVRAEVAIIGREVRVRQVMRWGAKDNAFFAGGVGDLVLGRFTPGQKSMTLATADIRGVLSAAGVNPAELIFRGASSVTIIRLDADADHAYRPVRIEARDIDEFLDKAGAPAVAAAKTTGAAAETPGPSPTGAEDRVQLASSRIDPLLPTPAPGGVEPGTTLRDSLVRQVCDRLGLKQEDIEITFSPADERVLRLASPMFSWSTGQTRLRNLGAVTWSVTIWTETNGVRSSKQVEVPARVRAWQTQVVARRGLTPGQLVREEDVEEVRVLVDRLPEQQLLTLEQAMMMQASREVAPGTVLAARMLDPVLLVRPGQLVSVQLRQGSIEVKAVARAVEGGAFGQTIRVKNEQTNNVLQVTVTGPQEARLGPGTAELE